MVQIDLNSDVGESSAGAHFGDDSAILQTVSSANIACGFHAGDPVTINSTTRTAAQNGVTVGAHIGYQDRAGFGRRFMDYAPDELHAEVLYQIGALEALAQVAGTEVRYVKPHGALYNTMVSHEVQARTVLDAISEYNDATDKNLAVLLLTGSYGLDYARETGLHAVAEAFADRAYNPDGTLVSRREPGAVLHDNQQVVENMLRLTEEGVLVAHDGTRIETEAASICTHGDTPGAVEMAQAVRTALENAGVEIRSFVDSPTR